LDDECALWGSSVADSVVDRWHGLGAQEVVVKLGASGCVWSDGSRREPVPASPVTQVIDTTGAGDAFNAGYIAGRLNGLSASHSAAQGHRLAAQVIQHIGAVIPSTFRS
jgi:2-dehydro-3-deoxygluconokinase